MLSKIAHTSIRNKVFGTVGICIAALVGISAFAMLQMNALGRELAAIAEQDIPLTRNLTQVATHQLEQTIQFEHMLRSALESQSNSNAVTAYEHAVKEFKKYDAQVTEELHQAEELAQNGVERSHSDAERAEFAHVVEALKSIEQEHETFSKHVDEVIALFGEGKIAEGMEKGNTIDAEAEKLDHELEALAAEIVKLTAEVALAAERHEKSALIWLMILAALAVTCSALVAWYVITRFLTGPLMNVASAITALTSGNTDIEVNVEYNDEIGKVAEAFETFRLKLIENKTLSAQARRTTESNR